MHKRLFILIIVCQCAFTAAAQKDFEYVDSSLIPKAETEQTTTSSEPSTEEENIVGDTSINIRAVIFEKDTVSAWKNRKEFSYIHNLDSLLRDKQKKEQAAKPAPTGSMNFIVRFLESGVLQAILWVIAIAVVIYILYQLFMSNGISFRKNTANEVAEQPTTDELFLQQDFDSLITQEYKLQNYRAATRYLFLKSLKLLSERSIINFEIDKTNSKYVHELPVNKQGPFSWLVLTYEYVWYGKVAIDREQFTAIESGFTSFIKSI